MSIRFSPQTIRSESLIYIPILIRQRNTMVYNSAAGLCLGVKNIRKNEPVLLSLCGSGDAKKWNFLIRMI